MKKRCTVLLVLVLFCFGVLGGRLGYLALGKTYHQTAAQQSSYLVVVDSPRGTVFDRTLASITNRQWVEKNGGIAGGVSILCKQPFSVVQSAAHFVGYLQENKGVSGLQLGYQETLTCRQTTLTYFRDALGQVVKGMEPVCSREEGAWEKGVVTTLWLPLQQAVERAFPSGKRGVVMVTHCTRGEVLAGASFPSFSPMDVAASFTNTASPLLNRMLEGYNLGSVLKLCVAAAALEQGISPTVSYQCQGAIQVGKTTFSCHEKKGHGTVTMGEALAVSCNPYFIHLAQQVGAEGVYQMAVALGLGEQIPLCNGITGKAGQLPQKEELSRSPAALANFAIGQGELLTTPLQVNSLTATIANGGVKLPLRLVLGLRDSQGQVTYQKALTGKRVLSPTTAHTLQTMMVGVVTHGTGEKGYYSSLPGGGKTSTAQTGMKNEKGEGVTHAWFTGFVPAENPLYAVTVLVEGGTSGGDTAAPVFYELCKIIEREGLLRE